MSYQYWAHSTHQITSVHLFCSRHRSHAYRIQVQKYYSAMALIFSSTASVFVLFAVKCFDL